MRQSTGVVKVVAAVIRTRREQHEPAAASQLHCLDVASNIHYANRFRELHRPTAADDRCYALAPPAKTADPAASALT